MFNPLQDSNVKQIRLSISGSKLDEMVATTNVPSIFGDSNQRERKGHQLESEMLWTLTPALDYLKVAHLGAVMKYEDYSFLTFAVSIPTTLNFVNL